MCWCARVDFPKLTHSKICANTQNLDTMPPFFFRFFFDTLAFICKEIDISIWQEMSKMKGKNSYIILQRIHKKGQNVYVNLASIQEFMYHFGWWALCKAHYKSSYRAFTLSFINFSCIYGYLRRFIGFFLYTRWNFLKLQHFSSNTHFTQKRAKKKEEFTKIAKPETYFTRTTYMAILVNSNSSKRKGNFHFNQRE